MLSSRTVNLYKVTISGFNTYLLRNTLVRRNPCCTPTIRELLQFPARCFITKVQTYKDEDSLLDKIKTNLKLIMHRSKLEAAGFILYETIADKIDYARLFQVLDLPDTFYSWYVITELHVWMLIARLMAEGERGKFLKKRLINCFWNDAQMRSKKLGEVNPAGIREQLHNLSEQFLAALIAYDEGLLSDDTTLAAAVWRRIYQLQKANPENIEYIVKFIRRQMKLLDLLTEEDLIERKHVIWETSKIKKQS
ncbi:ubiquinol-cytochrome-c reductase complex assembly factor 1 [Agrilus planipennis]|uniref:Ubiquinol-cytochrome-c reductase complex assembly factor 1 n=1 Tax=Agrilus planipennis TaxID=224129 RepID=A0A1W4X7L1_AGRPL|nr:ubiquinol-cytochrome-c reductase complex assembly factor 1 [Agrilus planipennis]